MCTVFVFLETGYTLLLLPPCTLQKTACSKPKVTLHSSEELGWSPWDSDAPDQGQFLGLWTFTSSMGWPLAWCPGSEGNAALHPHTVLQTGSQPVEAGWGSSSLTCTAEVQGPAPPTVYAELGSSHAEARVYHQDWEWPLQTSFTLYLAWWDWLRNDLLISAWLAEDSCHVPFVYSWMNK